MSQLSDEEFYSMIKCSPEELDRMVKYHAAGDADKIAVMLDEIVNDDIRKKTTKELVPLFPQLIKKLARIYAETIIYNAIRASETTAAVMAERVK